MGLGLFGGGSAVVRFLAARGAQVTVTDLRSEPDLERSLVALADVRFERVLGTHRDEDFQRAELVVVNPAVPPGSRYIELARQSGAELTSEAGLFLSRFRGRLVFVTGSKGKSTTSALCHAMLERTGRRAWLGGNIGRSFLSDLDRMGEEDVVVFEVSSFQLEQLRGLARAPECVVLTNLFPIHLERHGTFEAYVAAKREVFVGAKAAVVDHDDVEVRRLMASLEPVPVHSFSTVAAPPSGLVASGSVVHEVGGGVAFSAKDVRIPGAHNLRNAMAAWLAARTLGVDRAAAAAAIATFAGLPHRLELVAEVGGVRWINDSIATSPRAVAAAVLAIDGPITLLLGGKETEADLAPLRDVLVGRVRRVFAFGEAAGRVVREVASNGIEAESTTDLERAMVRARQLAEPGAAVLLSPGFPSYDQFRNFTERGERFRELVLAG